MNATKKTNININSNSNTDRDELWSYLCMGLQHWSELERYRFEPARLDRLPLDPSDSHTSQKGSPMPLTATCREFTRYCNNSIKRQSLLAWRVLSSQLQV